MFTFFLTWLIYSSSYHIDNAFPIEPTWLFLGFLGVGLHFLGQKIKKQHRIVTLIFFVMVTFLAIRTGKFLMAKMTFGMDFLEEAISSSLIGKGPTSFSSVFLWSAVGIFFRMTGLTVPFIFQNQAIDLTVTNDNLQAALTGHLNSIPHFHTLYTLRDSFAMFGGLGMILPMLFAIILYARKHKNKELLKLGYLTFIPIIVDQPIALILGLPIILEPILLIPMVIVTIGAEAIGALLLTLKWINPTVYGPPSLIFGFLASNGDWRYFFAVSLILVLSTLVFFPFCAIITAAYFRISNCISSSLLRFLSSISSRCSSVRLSTDLNEPVVLACLTHLSKVERGKFIFLDETATLSTSIVKVNNLLLIIIGEVTTYFSRHGFSPIFFKCRTLYNFCLV